MIIDAGRIENERRVIAAGREEEISRRGAGDAEEAARGPDGDDMIVEGSDRARDVAKSNGTSLHFRSMITTTINPFPNLVPLSIALAAALPWLVYLVIRKRGRFSIKSWFKLVVVVAVVLVWCRREWIDLAEVVMSYPDAIGRIWEWLSPDWLRVSLISTLALMLRIDWRLIQRERMRM